VQASTLEAREVRTGELRWKTADITPTVNSLWTDDGVVIATSVPFARSMVDVNAAESGAGIMAYSARDGSMLWRVEEGRSLTPFIAKGVLYTPRAHDLQTGRPIHGRAGGAQLSAGMRLLCSTLSACPTLAMSRQSSLGFRDLAGQSGTYQYPIVRSSCWINMIPAGGLVVVPEGGSSCMCAYNYKTSLALMSDDRHFHFGLGDSAPAGSPTLRVNFGAPGDRPDAAGQIWYAYPRPVAYGRCLGSQPYGPKVAGPRLPIQDRGLKGSHSKWGRNPDWIDIANTDRPWLQSFGLEGPIHLVVKRPTPVDPAEGCRVVLYFCELDKPSSPREFDIRLQGNTVLPGFNVLKAAGGVRRAVEREFALPPAETVSLELVPATGTAGPPIISGLAILAPR
jgi:hypothetical protein